MYVEVDFHDNKTIAQWLIDNPILVGEAICKGVCKAFGVVYKSVSTAPSIIYRVQLGAFSKKENAETFLENIKTAGFMDAFIAEVQNG